MLENCAPRHSLGRALKFSEGGPGRHAHPVANAVKIRPPNSVLWGAAATGPDSRCWVLVDKTDWDGIGWGPHFLFVGKAVLPERCEDQRRSGLTPNIARIKQQIAFKAL